MKTRAAVAFEAKQPLLDGAGWWGLLVDQSIADSFRDEQLKAHLTARACKSAAIWMQEGHNHSYAFIPAFMAHHLAWHADRP